MDVWHRTVNFEDARGLILDILTHRDIQHVTLLTSKQGAFRGDHYHKLSGQYTFLLAGELLYVSREPASGQVRRVSMHPHDLVFSPPIEAHGFLATQDSTIIVMTYGPRGGEDFEQDTYRLPAAESLRTHL